MSVRGTPPVAFHSPPQLDRPIPHTAATPTRHVVLPPCAAPVAAAPLANHPGKRQQEGSKDAAGAHRRIRTGNLPSNRRDALTERLRASLRKGKMIEKSRGNIQVGRMLPADATAPVRDGLKNLFHDSRNHASGYARDLGGDSVHSFVHSAALFRVAFSCLSFRKQEARHTLDFIGRNALFKVVEIRGVEPLTFSMPLRRSTN